MAGGPIDYSRLRIVPDPDTQEWWAGTRQHKFLVCLCQDCGHKWFPPWPACHNCGSMNRTWTEISGKGTVHSYIVAVQPILAAFTGAVPYVTAVIDVAEEDRSPYQDIWPLRLMGVLEQDEQDVCIGAPVEVYWEDSPTQEGISFPRFRVTAPVSQVQGAWQFPG